MAKPKLTKKDRSLVSQLVTEFENEKFVVNAFLDAIVEKLAYSEELKPLMHSYKFRMKDPTHLADKLERKILEAKAEKTAFEITKNNLFEKINDLAGIRILHLYTAQISQIDSCLRAIIDTASYELIEGPFARTWDDESKSFFKSIGMETEESKTMYTSVHYVIASNTRTRTTCEIQVRTLSEEVWGEVDHMLNYPHKTDSLPCREQLKVLARVTSSASRLVDSIFLTYDEHNKKSTKPK